MHQNVNEREKVICFRLSQEFTGVFDDLCGMLSSNRSEVIRYALKRFTRENLNNVENQKMVKEDMY
jgi:metal-responsive CopG/Arc/MetJ family transcriptional regulator